MRIENELITELRELKRVISLEDGQWTIKGFIDIYKNIYTITSDTKVISKLLEILLIPELFIFANKNGYETQLTPHQNYYPDISFIDKSNGDKYAIDLKTTYRNTDKK